MRVCAAVPEKHDKVGSQLFESVRLYNSSLHSQRCDIEYKLRAAEQYQGKKMFYPYFLDFRGRAYPIPPYLNHTGGDLSRGLLKVSASSPQGEPASQRATGRRGEIRLSAAHTEAEPK